MKKIIFMLAASVFCFQIAGFSQNRIGVSAGVSIANMKGQIDGNSKIGLMTSLVLDAPLGKKKNFSFRPTLSYVQKGQSEVVAPGSAIDKQYTALRYAELATDFVFYKLGPKGGFFVGLGPSLSFNLPSKSVTVIAGDKTNTIVTFGKTPAQNLRGVDYGIDFTGGWRTTGGFILSFNYNKGIRNLYSGLGSGSLKNSYFGIQMGVFINNGGNK